MTTPYDPEGDASMDGVQEKFRTRSLLAALKSLCDADCVYEGSNIRIRCDNHGDAIKRMREARAAISFAESLK